MLGMAGSVEVRTGERSVKNYLLRPMLKSKEAFQDGCDAGLTFSESRAAHRSNR